MLNKLRDEGAWLMPKAAPMANHRFDRVAHRHNPGLWIVRHGPVEHVANTKFIKHPGHETEMVQDLTPGTSVHSRLLSMRRFYRHTIITQRASG